MHFRFVGTNIFLYNSDEPWSEWCWRKDNTIIYTVLSLRKEKRTGKKGKQGDVVNWYTLIDQNGKIFFLSLVSQTIEELAARGKITPVS